ncbi:515_t:CDS:2, partial [Gigaspora rosea]
SEESSFYRKICQDLKKAKGIANFPIDGGGNHDDEWFKKVAEDLEVDLDDELLFNKKETNKGRQNNDGAKYKIQTLKLQLKELLSQPLVPRGVSTKYLTSGIVRDLADRLLNSSSCNSKILGMQKSKATEDLKLKKNYKKTSLKK